MRRYVPIGAILDIEVTPEAIGVLKRSLDLAGLDPSNNGIRLRTGHGLGGGLQTQIELADSPDAGEETIEAGGIKLFIAPAVIEGIPDPVLAVEPQHERVVLRSRAT
jgi:Fe-S cluster assembly iron-binding protein IscA